MTGDAYSYYLFNLFGVLNNVETLLDEIKRGVSAVFMANLRSRDAKALVGPLRPLLLLQHK